MAYWNPGFTPTTPAVSNTATTEATATTPAVSVQGTADVPTSTGKPKTGGTYTPSAPETPANSSTAGAPTPTPNATNDVPTTSVPATDSPKGTYGWAASINGWEETPSVSNQPVVTPTPTPTRVVTDVRTWTVKAGDTLSGIARDILGPSASTTEVYKYVEDLKEINGLTSDRIRVGDVLYYYVEVVTTTPQPSVSVDPYYAHPETPTEPASQTFLGNAPPPTPTTNTPSGGMMGARVNASVNPTTTPEVRFNTTYYNDCLNGIANSEAAKIRSAIMKECAKAAGRLEHRYVVAGNTNTEFTEPVRFSKYGYTWEANVYLKNPQVVNGKCTHGGVVYPMPQVSTIAEKIKTSPEITTRAYNETLEFMEHEYLDAPSPTTGVSPTPTPAI